MSFVGGALITRWAPFAATLLLAVAFGGCVQQAALENQVRHAEWQARTLSTQTDLRLAGAALSAQLVELEALYQQSPDDRRVLELLTRGYLLWARGFVEVSELEAVEAGDAARAERERRLGRDAESRAHYYASKLSPPPRDISRLATAFTGADAACARHDRASYERELGGLLGVAQVDPEQRLETALLEQLAAIRLLPKVAARCGF